MREQEPIQTLCDLASRERLKLHVPAKPYDAVRALAASGRSGFARASQDELRRREIAELAKELGRDLPEVLK